MQTHLCWLVHSGRGVKAPPIPHSMPICMREEEKGSQVTCPFLFPTHTQTGDAVWDDIPLLLLCVGRWDELQSHPYMDSASEYTHVFVGFVYNCRHYRKWVFFLPQVPVCPSHTFLLHQSRRGTGHKQPSLEYNVQHLTNRGLNKNTLHPGQFQEKMV